MLKSISMKLRELLMTLRYSANSPMNLQADRKPHTELISSDARDLQALPYGERFLNVTKHHLRKIAFQQNASADQFYL
jgi:hypothetical protein